MKWNKIKHGEVKTKITIQTVERVKEVRVFFSKDCNPYKNDETGNK